MPIPAAGETVSKSSRFMVRVQSLAPTRVLRLGEQPASLRTGSFDFGLAFLFGWCIDVKDPARPPPRALVLPRALGGKAIFRAVIMMLCITIKHENLARKPPAGLTGRPGGWIKPAGGLSYFQSRNPTDPGPLCNLAPDAENRYCTTRRNGRTGPSTGRGFPAQ